MDILKYSTPGKSTRRFTVSATSADGKTESPQNLPCDQVQKCMQPATANERFVCQLIVHVQNVDCYQPYNAADTSTGLSGTGFILGDIDGGDDYIFIVTAHHVVDGMLSAEVKLDALDSAGKAHEATLMCFNADLDIALLRMPIGKDDSQRLYANGERGLRTGNSDELRPLSPVRALGFALGGPMQTTAGVISGRTPDALQLDAAVNPGNSGGPLIDRKGSVVGLVVSGVNNAQNVNYACPITEGVASLQRMMSRMRDEEGVVTERVATLNAAVCNSSSALLRSCSEDCRGVCVTFVQEGSCLQSAKCLDDPSGWVGGIAKGDFIADVQTGGSLRTAIDSSGRVRRPDMWSAPIHFHTLLSRFTGHRDSHAQVIRLWAFRRGVDGARCFEVKLQECRSSLRMVYPPEPLDYHVFAGVVFMPLRTMHISGHKAFGKFGAVMADPRREAELTVVVTHVHPESPMLRGKKIQNADEIIRVNGESFSSFEAFKAALRSGEYVIVESVGGMHACTSEEAREADNRVKRRLGTDHLS